LRYVKSAAEIAGKNLKKGAVVVLESTVYPGVTEEVVAPVLDLENESGLKCGADFKIGYSPERINPGDDAHALDKITKIVAGMDDDTTGRLAELYGLITNVYKAKDIRTAEAAKVIENIQRDLNIALMNELWMTCYRLQITDYCPKGAWMVLLWHWGMINKDFLLAQAKFSFLKRKSVLMWGDI